MRLSYFGTLRVIERDSSHGKGRNGTSQSREVKLTNPGKARSGRGSKKLKRRSKAAERAEERKRAMQQRGQAAGFKATRLAATGLAKTGTAGVVLTEAGEVEGERKRVEAVVETLAKLRGAGVSLAEVAHDARNMVTALGLYSDLLEEPGVLTPAFHHYANELRLVATASRRLVEKLLVLDARQTPVASSETATGSGEFCPGEEQPAAGRLSRSTIWPLKSRPTAICWRPWPGPPPLSPWRSRAVPCRCG